MTAHAIPTGKPLILCVDDSESQLWLRAKVLEKNGFSVLTASTASKALQWMRQAAVSLVLSDHMLGGITGTELAAEVKKVSQMCRLCSTLVLRRPLCRMWTALSLRGSRLKRS